MKKTAKNRINFTKNTLINLPIPSQSRAIYYDTNEDKLYLQITPAGTKTFYLLKKVNTETLKIKIGRFPDMAIDKARSIAKTLKQKLKMASIQQNKNANSSKILLSTKCMRNLKTNTV